VIGGLNWILEAASAHYYMRIGSGRRSARTTLSRLFRPIMIGAALTKIFKPLMVFACHSRRGLALRALNGFDLSL
jgi:hypothetical protein